MTDGTSKRYLAALYFKIKLPAGNFAKFGQPLLSIGQSCQKYPFTCDNTIEPYGHQVTAKGVFMQQVIDHTVTIRQITV